MNSNPSLHAMNPLTEDDIANYLVNTPDFFERHAQLLAQVQLTSPHGSRAVSLQERQAGMLREKIKVIEQRLIEMVRHGTENAVIVDRLLRWTCGLLATRDAQALPLEIAGSLQQIFHIPQVAIRVWNDEAVSHDAPWAQGVDDDVKALATSLELPYCGTNSGFEAANWLEDPHAAVSLALIPLRAERGAPAMGLLVLASPDSQRFNAEMGTDFLERLAELASAALVRLG